MRSPSSHDPAREVLLSVARDKSPVAEMKCHALFELIDTSHSLGHGLRRDLALSDLTEHGFRLLAHIVRHESESLTPGAMADRLGLPRPVVSSTLGRLEVSGLITRERSPQDRRFFTLQLTDEGRRVFQAALGRCLKSINDLMSGVDPQEVARLNQTCTRLREHFLQHHSA